MIDHDRGVGHDDGAIVTPMLGLGISGTGRNRMVYDSQVLTYPVGVFCASYNQATSEMLMLPAHDKVRSIVAIAVSGNKKYVACTENAEDAEGQQVSVYSLQTQKRIRTLAFDSATAQAVQSLQVVCINFSESSKLLLTQYGAPDNALVIWRWYSGKVICTVRLEAEVLQAAFSPVENSLIVTASALSANMHRLDANEGTMQSMVVTTAEPSSSLGQFTNFCWLAANQLALVTSQGWVQVNQDKEVKGTLVTEQGDHLIAVAARSRGLVVAGTKGVIYVFDPVDQQAKKLGNHDPFKLVRRLVVNLPGAAMPSMVPLPFGSDEMMQRNAVLDLSVSSGEDSFALVTAGGEVLTVSMTAAQDFDDKTAMAVGHDDEYDLAPFTLLLGGFGSARILSLDAITFQPLMLTASADRMVRLTNYKTHCSVAARCMEDEVLSCTLHPSGTQLVIAMHSCVRIFGVAQDELIPRCEFAFKRCNLVRYSHSGAVFAAVGRSNNIVLYHAYRMQQVGVLKAHVSAVTSLSFSPDDRTLVSTGAGGAVYFWDLDKMERLMQHEYVDKRSIYASATPLARHLGAVARTHDGRIQHLQGGKVEYEVAGLPGGEASPVALLGEDAVLLAACQKGTLFSYRWPLNFLAADAMGSPREYRLHAESPAGITAMVVLPTAGLLLTAGGDGTVIVSRLDLVLRGQLLEAGDTHVPAQTTQYITVAEDRLTALREKQHELLTLIATTKSNCEYQVFRQTQALRDLMNRLQSENSSLQEQLDKRNSEVHDLLANGAEREKAVVKELESSHMVAAEELEGLYEQRLELERAKLRKMAAAMDDMQFKLEEQMARQGDKHQREIAELKSDHQMREDTLQAEIRLLSDRHQNTEEFHNVLSEQAELDFEENTERLEKKMENASKASDAREGRLKADNNLLKRTCLRLKGDKAIEMKKMERLMRDNNALREGLTDQQVTIGKLRQELEERDTVMADNYGTIQMLRRQVQDLEKHKFVLGHKAESYQAQLYPKTEEAARLAAELEAHDKELVSELNRINQLNRSVGEKEGIIRSLKVELQDVKLCMKRQGDMLRLFSFDLHQVMNASDANSAGGRSKRQELLQELYKKYCVHKEPPRGADEVEAELNRHLHMSELRSSVLEYRLQEQQKRGHMNHREDQHQNVQLLRELQVLQQDSKEKARQMEDVQAELRELQARYRLLELRSKGVDHGAAGDKVGSSLTKDSTFSMAGRVAPSRPSSAYPANRILAARPPSAVSPRGAGVASSSSPYAADRPASASYRAMGSSPPGGPGNLARGSAARAVHELIGVERENITSLMAQMQITAADLERQRQAVSQTLMSAAVAEEAGEEAGEEGDENPAELPTSSYSASQAASLIRKHGISNNNQRRPVSALNKTSPQQVYGTPPRRRPTSAAGVGARAFLSSNSKLPKQ